MCSIKNFECYKDVDKFIKSKTFRLVNTGSEGSCFEGKDNKAYKLIEYAPEGAYLVENVITKDDINLQSFAFPEEVYTVDGVVRGYKTEYIENDLFGPSNTYNIKTMDSINFDTLSKSYKVMLKDVVELSKHNILIYDMPFNILFDNKKLTAIDTCCYKKVNDSPLEDNIKSLNCSFELLFDIWFSDYKKTNFQVKDNNIDDFLKDVYISLPKTMQKRVDKARKK